MMAEPIPFREANSTLLGGRPDVGDLPTFKDGTQIISCWRFTVPELAEIQRTGVVWVRIMAPVTQPPILIESHRPFQT